MKDTTPWLVIVTDGSSPPSTMRLRCNNCGGVYDVLLPIPVSQLTRVHDRIKSIHKGCKVHDPVAGLGAAGKAGKEVEVDAGDALDRKP